MAHRITVEVRPHRNKGTGKSAEGSLSPTKKDYVVIDRHRGKRIEVGVASSMKATAKIITDHRQFIMAQHLLHHPNDWAFIKKHKIVSKETANV